jgi:hypothetical protein
VPGENARALRGARRMAHGAWRGRAVDDARRAVSARGARRAAHGGAAVRRAVRCGAPNRPPTHERFGSRGGWAAH